MLFFLFCYFMNSTILKAINTLQDFSLEFGSEKYIFESFNKSDDFVVVSNNGKKFKILLNKIEECDYKPEEIFLEGNVSLISSKEEEVTIPNSMGVPPTEEVITTSIVDITPTEASKEELKNLFGNSSGQNGGYDGSTLNSISDFKGIFLKNQGGGYYNENNNSTIGNMTEFKGKKHNNVDFLQKFLLKGGSNKGSNVNRNYNFNSSSATSDFCE